MEEPPEDGTSTSVHTMGESTVVSGFIVRLITFWTTQEEERTPSGYELWFVESGLDRLCGGAARGREEHILTHHRRDMPAVPLFQLPHLPEHLPGLRVQGPRVALRFQGSGFGGWGLGLGVSLPWARHAGGTKKSVINNCLYQGVIN